MPPPSVTDGHHLVFVGGLHRSGTSILARLLAEHPQGSGLTATGVPEDEGQHVQDVYPVGERYGGPGRFARNPAAHLTEDSPLATPENAQRILRSWQPYWDTSKPFLVEKSPPNVIMSRFLQALYPDASFVFLLRHPVTVSLATRKWRRRTPFGRLLDHWFLAHDLMREDLPHLKRAHVVKYEQLLAEPGPTLAAVADFLGLTSVPDGSRLSPAHDRSYRKAWAELSATEDRIGRRRVARWQQKYADRARGYGYDLIDLDVVEPLPFLP